VATGGSDLRDTTDWTQNTRVCFILGVIFLGLGIMPLLPTVSRRFKPKLCGGLSLSKNPILLVDLHRQFEIMSFSEFISPKIPVPHTRCGGRNTDDEQLGQLSFVQTVVRCTQWG
jgi:hypothetical protein